MFGAFLHLSSRIKADFCILRPAPNCTGSDTYYGCAHLLLGTCEWMRPSPSFGAECSQSPAMLLLNLNTQARVPEYHEQ